MSGIRPGGASGGEVLQRVGDLGAIAILRFGSWGEAVRAGLPLIDAGLEVIEVSFTTPDATRAIERLLAERPDALVGAGTVLTAEDSRRAATAGARFLLSPAYGEEVAAVAADLGLPYIPGVFTAQDVWRCLQSGLEVLKVFPAAPLGPAGMRALLEPFPQVRPVPTGGIAIDAAADWMRAGALALGMGGALTKAADPADAAEKLRQAMAAR